jgi:molecular chaperone GrpE
MSKKDKTTPEEQTTIDQQEQVMVEESMDETLENGSAEEAYDEESASLRQQLDEVRDKYMRMYAEFENYKKRSVREKLDWMKTAAQDTMSALLPVLDDFDRAKKFAGEKTETGWSEGVELVYQKLYNILKQKGLEPMQSTGEVFDPELHDAITEIPAPAEELKGKVVDTIEKGYRLNDKIIRHAKVVVGK